VRLRGRFTLWFSLAALLPIIVAAAIAREVLSRSYRKEYALARAAAEQGVRRELAALEGELATAVAAVADREAPLVGGLLQDMKKEGAELSHETRRRTKETTGQTQRGLALDVLTLLGSWPRRTTAPPSARSTRCRRSAPAAATAPSSPPSRSSTAPRSARSWSPRRCAASATAPTRSRGRRPRPRC
jgi:hypothetical protein